MREREGAKALNRMLRYLRIGLSVFALVLLPVSLQGPGGAGMVVAEVVHATEMAGSHVVAKLNTIDAEFDLSDPVYRGTDRGDAILILALVFSGIVAFNLWLVRHLHCVYAPSLQVSGGASNCR